MKAIKSIFWVVALALSMTGMNIFSEGIVVYASTGESVVIEYAPEETFVSVWERIEGQLQVIEGGRYAEGNFREVISGSMVFEIDAVASVANDGGRDYYRHLIKTEKNDLRYILTTLAKESLIYLLKKKPDLQKAGDRIDHIHPLRFLLTCFTDDELQGSFHCVYDKGGRVWGKFFGEIKKNLNEEAQRDNMQEEYVKDFAKKLKINYSQTLSAIKNKKWDQLISILIKQIPRAWDPGRYDM